MIKLRHLKEDDLGKVLEWRTSEPVTKYMFSDIGYNIQKQKEWFYEVNSDPTKQIWVLDFYDKDVGIVNITDIDIINRRCFKGYYIAEDCALGLGLSKHLECNIYDYIFLTLGLNKVYSDALAFNKRAIHVYKKFGSEVEGVFKQHIYKNGQFHDVLRMGMLKEKWLSIRDEYNYEQISIEPFEWIGGT